VLWCGGCGWRGRCDGEFCWNEWLSCPLRELGLRGACACAARSHGHIYIYILHARHFTYTHHRETQQHTLPRPLSHRYWLTDVHVHVTCCVLHVCVCMCVCVCCADTCIVLLQGMAASRTFDWGGVQRGGHSAHSLTHSATHSLRH